jgi:hypothetical protein
MAHLRLHPDWEDPKRKKALLFASVFSAVFVFAVVLHVVLRPSYAITIAELLLFFGVVFPLFLITLDALSDLLAGKALSDYRNPFVGMFWSGISLVVLTLLFMFALKAARWLFGILP